MARAAAVALVSAAAVLALAAAATAGYAPHLTATSTNDGLVTLDYSQAAANDGPAVIALYGPPAYAALATPSGAVVGNVTAHAIGAGLGGSTILMRGNVRVASASTPLESGDTVGARAQECGGGGATTALWVATLTGYLQTLKLGLAVRPLTSGPLKGGIEIVLCPPPTAVATGSPAGTPLGLKVVQLSLEFAKPITVPAAIYAWHLWAAPYVSTSASLDTSGVVEAEASSGTPQLLTLTAEAAGRSAAVSGRLTLGAEPVAAQKVQIYANGKVVGAAKTDGTGAFSTAVRLAKGRTLVLARALVPARYATTCGARLFPAVPCTSSILDGFAAASSPVAVRAAG